MRRYSRAYVRSSILRQRHVSKQYLRLRKRHVSKQYLAVEARFEAAPRRLLCCVASHARLAQMAAAVQEIGERVVAAETIEVFLPFKTLVGSQFG